MRSAYEIALLEVRQGLNDAEKLLRNRACISILQFRRVEKLKELIEEEIINCRKGLRKHKDLERLMEG